MNADVIVIGAGVAGLAAAVEVSRRGFSVLILEARNRIGGRVWSITPPGRTPPIELGAEFVHGGNEAIKNLLRRAGVEMRPSAEDMWWRIDGELRRIPDFWERIIAVTEMIPVNEKRQAFATFLKRNRSRLSAEDRWLAAHYAESFNAASVGKLSAAAMRENHGGADETDFKIDGPNDSVAEQLRRQFPEDRVTLRLRRAVTTVHWRRGDVKVTTSGTGRSKASEIHRARAVIVTVPLGVLKAGIVTFQPGLGSKQTLIKRLGWGQVVRITFRFRQDFWELVPAQVRGSNGRFTGFLNAPGEMFPVWWALLPDAPVLTAWVGGQAADVVAGLSPARQVRAALGSLASILGTTSSDLRAQLIDWHTHDWNADPYARGAYSYAVAGCQNGPERLAEPIANTLFFAGEATTTDLGTVHGAIKSGYSAAEKLAELINQEP